MQITTDMIKQLRETTGAGILDCRKALESSDGDMKKAIDFLREKGLAMAAKRSDRQASEGVVELYSHGGGRVGVMVEVNCETDFVGRSEAFRNLAHELALQIAAAAPLYINEEDIPAEVIEHETQDRHRQGARRRQTRSDHPQDRGRLAQQIQGRERPMRQVYIRDESMTIQELINQNIAAIGENMVIRRFAR